jgi:hypothetical protein
MKLALNNRTESQGRNTVGVSTSDTITLHSVAADHYPISDVVRAFQDAIRDAGLSPPKSSRTVDCAGSTSTGIVVRIRTAGTSCSLTGYPRARSDAGNATCTRSGASRANRV